MPDDTARCLSIVEDITAQKRIAERTARLQAATAALAGTLRPAEVAQEIVGHAVVAVGAQGGAVARLVDGGAAFEALRVEGYAETPPQVAAEFGTWARFPADTATPFADAVRTGQPVLFASGAERLQRYPHLVETQQVTGNGAAAAVPLISEGRPIGVMHLRFAGDHPFPQEEVAFLEAMARVCAQALERARQYEETESARARYRAVVEQSADAIVMVEGTTAVYANDAYLALLGVTDRSAVIGQTGDSWVHPDDRDVVSARALARQRGEPVPPAYEFRVLRSDGEVRHVEVTATPITHQGRAATLAVLRDVTDRKRAEAAQRLLAEASRVLGASLDYERTLAAVAGIVVPALAEWCTIYLREDGELHRAAVAHADPEGERLLHQLARHYGYRADRPDPVVRVVETGEAQLVPAVAPKGLTRYAHDAEHLRLLRQLDPHSSIVIPLVARGEVIGAMGLNRTHVGPPYRPEDLSLARQIADRCAVAIDNARLYADAQAAIRARDQFLSIAAHELRTPVTTIKGNIQLVARRQARGQLGEAQLAQFVDGALQGADRLVALVEDLLDVSRVRTGRLPLRLEAVDLGMLVREVLAERRERPAGLRIGILAPAGIGVQADPGRLRQVLGNLLDNAIKYSPEGGTIRISVAAVGHEAVVTVTDEGIGLPPGAAAAIFQPFGRAANAIERRLPGMGLGLYVSRAIVEQHGGRIWAESEGENRGSTVSFALPIDGASDDGAPEATDGAPEATDRVPEATDGAPEATSS